MRALRQKYERFLQFGFNVSNLNNININKYLRFVIITSNKLH